MAKSQRPPDWTTEEVLLGLDTYFRHGRQQLPRDHSAMERLREELLEIAPEVHPGRDPSPTFRNLDGLSYKFGGYIGLDPAHDASGTNWSSREEELFPKFLDDSAGMHLQVLQIREGLGLTSEINRWWTEASGSDWDPKERFWIEITDREDLGADLHAPRYDRSGQENWRYALLLDVRPGDVIFHYDKDEQAVVARSRAKSWARDQPILWTTQGTYSPDEDLQERLGLRVELTGFEYLDSLVALEELQRAIEDLQSVRDELEEQYDGALYLPFETYEEVRPKRTYLAKFPSAYFELSHFLQSAVQTSSIPAGGAASVDTEITSDKTGQGGLSGQDYASGAAERDAIEEASMEAATAHFEAEGYNVEDKSSSNPYDLLCKKGEERLYVEVKGTTTSGTSVYLTHGEVEHVRKHKGEAVLFVLKEMELVEAESGPKAQGGEREVRWPWQLDESRLEPTQYRYRLI